MINHIFIYLCIIRTWTEFNRGYLAGKVRQTHRNDDYIIVSPPRKFVCGIQLLSLLERISNPVKIYQHQREGSYEGLEEGLMKVKKRVL